MLLSKLDIFGNRKERTAAPIQCEPGHPPTLDHKFRSLSKARLLPSRPVDVTIDGPCSSQDESLIGSKFDSGETGTIDSICN
jgi:hypothetical protein